MPGIIPDIHKEAFMLGLSSRADEQQLIEELKKSDNLDYVLGWFCGSMLIVGMIVAAIFFRQGRRRKSVQALVLPLFVLVATAIWFALMYGITEMFSLDQKSDFFMVPLFFIVFFSFPIIGLRFLRSLQWPAWRGMNH
jgi:hypothetical protein